MVQTVLQPPDHRQLRRWLAGHQRCEGLRASRAPHSCLEEAKSTERRQRLCQTRLGMSHGPGQAHRGDIRSDSGGQRASGTGHRVIKLIKSLGD